MKLVIYPAVDDGRLKRIVKAAAAMRVVNCATEQEAVGQMPDADAMFGKLTPALLAAASKLSWVQAPTASLEHYLFPELVEHDCRLTNMRGIYSDVIADHVMGYVLCLARNLHTYIRHQLEARWEPLGGEAARTTFEAGPGQVSAMDLAHRQLAGATMGIVGLGGIGAEIARRAKAFNMRVVGVDPVVKSLPEVERLWGLDGLDDLLSQSEYVVIAAPHTPRTAGLFDYARIAKMQPTAYLINIGRGVIVKLKDLDRALAEGRIAGAALDVFETEPLPADHPLWTRPNAILTPHIAACSPPIAERHTQRLLDNVKAFTTGRPLENIVDKREWF